MPRLCCEISVGFLEEVNAKPRPEGNKSGLEVESWEAPTATGHRASQARPQAAAQELEAGTTGPEGTGAVECEWRLSRRGCGKMLGEFSCWQFHAISSATSWGQAPA